MHEYEVSSSSSSSSSSGLISYSNLQNWPNNIPESTISLHIGNNNLRHLGHIPTSIRSLDAQGNLIATSAAASRDTSYGAM